MTEATAVAERAPLILLVDDEPMLRSFLARELRSAGYQVHVEESGNKALIFMRKTVPDLVISDIRMPDGDGLMVLKSAKEKSREMPVLMISGYTEIPEHEFFNQGAVCLLHKPFDITELIATVRKNLLPESERIDICKDLSKVNLDVKFLTDLDSAVREKHFLPGRGGFTLYSSQLYGKGQSLNFSLGFTDEILKGTGIVQWVKKSEDHLPCQLGIELEGLEQSSQKRWIELLNLFKPVAYLPGPA